MVNTHSIVFLQPALILIISCMLTELILKVLHMLIFNIILIT